MPQKSIEVLVQELKDNIGNSPRKAVEEVLVELYREALEYRNCTVGNFYIPESYLEQYKVVFGDDVVLRQMLERQSLRAIEQFNHMVSTRYRFALSGAMRWPNSQEAAMFFSSEYEITMK